MKIRILSTSIGLAVAITLSGQQQPENPGFENWENTSVGGGPTVYEPVDWSSIRTSDGGDFLNNLAPTVWEQSTDAHSGTYSVRLFTASTIIGPAPGTITNGRIHATLGGEGWAFTVPTNANWNTPLSQKPDSIAVWAKFTKAGTDVAQIKAVIHGDGTAKISDEDSVNYIGVSSIFITESVAEWTRFSAPFTYLNELDPAFVLMVLSTSDESATLGSQAFFDDLEFIYNPISLDLKVFLEGPYAGGSEMSTFLNPDHIPYAQPYSGAPWNYTGTEFVFPIPNPDIVDWVLVEIRDAATAANATSSTMLQRKAGFLLKDGSIVGLDGVSRLTFDYYNYDINENLFVAVWHRNHLAVMSANPLVKSNGVYAYDFSDAADKTYGGSSGNKQLELFGPGIWGMIGGDGDANGTVNTQDKTSFWSIFTGKSGYLSSDYNMNGQTSNPDKNDIWLENIDRTSQVPN